MKFSVISTIFLLGLVSVSAHFEPIKKQPKDYDGIEIQQNYCCDGQHFEGQVPKVMYTIEPSKGESSYTILTDPANLLQASANKGDLKFCWNFDVAGNATKGKNVAGVKIQLPPSKLKKISSQGNIITQIADGFTDVMKLSAAGNSTVNAQLQSLSISNIELIAESARTVTVEVHSDVEAEVSVEDGELFLKGDVKGVQVKSGGFLHVDGKIKKRFNVTGGHVEVSKEGGCDKVNGNCTVNEELEVVVPEIKTFVDLGQFTEKCNPTNGGSSTKYTTSIFVLVATVLYLGTLSFC